MIELKKARPEDAEALLAYLRRIGGETDNLSFGPEGLPVTVEEERAYLERVAQDPKALQLCVWQDGELVGDANISPYSRRMRHRAELGISVVQAAWGQGIGSMLMQTLVDHARAVGFEVVDLQVRSDNARAIRLYEKFGFRKIGTFPAFLKVDGINADADLMVLELR